MSKKCYICGKKGTSKEHVPAKCFFPNEEKYRKNLITVSSCSIHNEDTSKDDEYVKNIITMYVGNNSIAFKQFINKSIKSLEKNDSLFKETIQNPKKIYIRTSNKKEKTIAFEIDRNRFDNVIKKISYALFFNNYKEIWNKGLIVITDKIKNPDMSDDDLGLLFKSFKPLFIEPTFDGNNPQIFKYKFIPTTENINDGFLWMKFYEGFEVFVSPKENTFKPEL